MSRYGGDFRSSAGNLGYAGPPEPQRWDPERFARERADRLRGPPVVERERFEERDIYESRGGGRRRESSADDFYSSRAGGGGRGPMRFEEKDRYIVEEKFGPPARLPRGGPARYYDEDVDSMDGSPNRGQMVPFESRRRQSITAERGYGPPSRRAAPRPNFIRRQSSLDTFDRKPMPRYGDQMREPPEIIPIPIGRRRRSPPRFVERDFEEVRVAEPEYHGDEEFRGFRERERSTVRRRRAGSEIEYRETETFELEEEEPERIFPKKGKTKMPKRLVNKRAIIDMGYPFEEEGDTIIILKALGKDHIDEVIKVSREMNESGEIVREESRTTYMIEAPQAPPPPPEPQVIERRTEIIVSPPQQPAADVPRSVREWDVMSSSKSERREHSPSAKSTKSTKSRKSSKSGKSKSRHRSHSDPESSDEEEYEEKERGESNAMRGPLALVLPERRKNEQSIKAEIRALEAEKKALKYEREYEKEHRKAERYNKDGDITIERAKDVVKVEKDRKAPNPRLVKAMLATLT